MFGAYTPDEADYPQQWPPVAYQRFARDCGHLPLVQWQPRPRRPTRGMVVARWLAVLTVVAFALSRCGG